MAFETFQAQATGVAYAANKNMLTVHNGSASAKLLRIWAMLALNNQTSAVTGVLNRIQIWRQTTAPTGMTTITPVGHSPANAVLDGATLAGHAGSVTNSALLRVVQNSTDEPTVSTLDLDSIWTLIPYATIWDAGRNNQNVQPLTCPIGTACGYGMFSLDSTVGVNDMEISFSSSAS